MLAHRGPHAADLSHARVSCISIVHQLLFLPCPCRAWGVGEPWQSGPLVLWEAGMHFPPQFAVIQPRTVPAPWAQVDALEQRNLLVLLKDGVSASPAVENSPISPGC